MIWIKEARQQKRRENTVPWLLAALKGYKEGCGLLALAHLSLCIERTKGYHFYNFICCFLTWNTKFTSPFLCLSSLLQQNLSPVPPCTVYKITSVKFSANCYIFLDVTKLYACTVINIAAIGIKKSTIQTQFKSNLSKFEFNLIYMKTNSDLSLLNLF